MINSEHLCMSCMREIGAELECPYCHEIFESYGNKTRKYCCHEHYVLDRFCQKRNA